MSMDLTKAEQILLEANVAKKYITDYLNKYYARFEIDDYLEYCKCEDERKNIRKLEKYVKSQFEEMTFSEFLSFIDIIQEMGIDPEMLLYHKGSQQYILYFIRHKDELSAELYNKLLSKEAKENFFRYFYWFPKDEDEYALKSFVLYLQEGLPIKEEESEDFSIKMALFGIECAKEWFREKSIIEKGHLKKFEDCGATTVFIPDEVVVVDENAFSGTDIYRIFLHDSFERFNDNSLKDVHIMTTVDLDKSQIPDDYFDESRMPKTIKYIAPNIFYEDADPIYVPEDLENFEELEEIYFGVRAYPQPEPDIKEIFKNTLSENLKLRNAVDLFVSSLNYFKEAMKKNSWADPTLALETRINYEIQNYADFDTVEQFFDIIKLMPFSKKHGNSENFREIAFSYIEGIKDGSFDKEIYEGGLSCYEILIAIVVAIRLFIDYDCEAILPFCQSKWEFRGDYDNDKWLCYEITSQYPDGNSRMYKKTIRPSELYSTKRIKKTDEQKKTEITETDVVFEEIKKAAKVKKYDRDLSKITEGNTNLQNDVKEQYQDINNAENETEKTSKSDVEKVHDTSIADDFVNFSEFIKEPDKFKEIKTLFVDSDIKEIPDFVCEYCIIEKISMSDSVKKIGKSAFSCSHAKEISLSKSLESIDEAAFILNECIEIILPDTIKRIGKKAFANSDFLQELKIPKNLTVIEEKCFSNCKNLKKVTFSKNLQRIGNGAFEECRSLEKIVLPKGLTTISPRAFAWCTALKTVVIPDSVTKIGKEAFKGCRQIEKIECSCEIRKLLTDEYGDQFGENVVGDVQKEPPQIINNFVAKKESVDENRSFISHEDRRESLRLTDIGESLNSDGRKMEAQSYFLQALKLDPYNSRAVMRKGLFFSANDDILTKTVVIRDNCVRSLCKLLDYGDLVDMHQFYVTVTFLRSFINGFASSVEGEKKYYIADNEVNIYENILKNLGETLLYIGDDIYGRNINDELNEFAVSAWEDGIILWNNNLPENISKDEYLSKIRKHHPNFVITKTTSAPDSGNVQQSTGGCYIATCVYGSYDCPQVWILRRYRDKKLSKSYFGRWFIKIYYLLSPKLVKLFGDTMTFKRLWKYYLDKKIYILQKNGFENTPYYDNNDHK